VAAHEPGTAELTAHRETYRSIAKRARTELGGHHITEMAERAAQGLGALRRRARARVGQFRDDR
jgi:hypothetical protein